MFFSTSPSFGGRGSNLGQILRRHRALAHDSSADSHAAIIYGTNNPNKQAAVTWMANAVHNLGKNLVHLAHPPGSPAYVTFMGTAESKLTADCAAAADTRIIQFLLSNSRAAKAELLQA